ncbi:MAG: restriction endonuclease subunit S [Victivallales bacterium]
MASKWNPHILEDCMDAIIDYRGKTPRKTDCGIPLVTAKIIKDGRITPYEEYIAPEEYDAWMRRGIPLPGDVVMTMEAPLGEVAQLDDTKVALAQRVITLRGKRKVLDNIFLKFLMQSRQVQEQIHGRASGTTVLGIKQSELRKITLLIPPLSEQKAIAHILGTLDDKIAANRRMNETLEQMAQALFKSWFVDFDPVRAKAESRDTGLPPEISKLFPDFFENSEFGEIPKGWKLCPLTEVVEVNPRRTLRAGDIAPYLDMKNTPTQGHCAEDVIERVFTTGIKFQNGDTLLARITPCLENGKTAFVDFLEERQIGWGSTEFIVFTPLPPLPPQFAYFLARSEELRAHAIKNMTGTSGRQRVPSGCFHSFILAVPPADIAQCFGKFTAPLMEKIKNNVEESRTLANLRDSLLPKLMSGEL